MKKTLFLAIAFVASALAFTACDNNGASLPSAANKAIEQSTVNAPAMLGMTVSDAHESLIQAGYILMDQAPAFMAHKRAKKADDNYNSYIYGIDSDTDFQNEEALYNAMVKAINAGKSIIHADLAYENGKVVSVNTEIITQIKSSVNKVYTGLSQKIYDKAKTQVGSGEMSWEGTTSIKEEQKRYSNHSDYVSAVAAASEIEAGELLMNSAYYYQAQWIYPDEEVRKQMEKEDFKPYVIGMFFFGSMEL